MKFEYIVRDVSKSQEVNLNFLGREGWRLVSVDNGIAYLERELHTKSEAEILAHFDTVSWPPERRSEV